MRLILLIGFSLSLTSSCFGSVLRCASNDEDPSCLPNMEQKGISNLSWGNQCAPGTYWKTECNTCTCEPGGFATCTKVGCDNERSRVCAPGSQWTNDCNATCWCIDGQPKCNKDCTVSLDTNKRKVLELKEGEECAPGTAWHTECNSCICSPQGLAMCTLNSCLNERKTKCAPNTFWKYQCNSCYCYDGRPLCTLLACESPDGKTNKTTMKQPENKECVPGTSWKTDCNECSCQPDGFRICTNFHCDENDPVLFEESTTKKSPELTTKSSLNKTIVCVANRMFIKDCNTCWCNDDGTSFFCTRKVCIPELPEDVDSNNQNTEELRVIHRECRPNEVFELDCNMCRCNPDGKSFSCTRRACAEQTDDVQNSTLVRKVRGLSQGPLKACQPGSEFRMDCNQCLCDDEGQAFSCTRIDCNAQNNNNNGGLRSKRDTTEKIATQCTPGSVFERGCNVCRCTGEGEALCTNNKCGKVYTVEVTSATPAPVNSNVDSNFRCNPGEQFNFECNDCTCSADGKDVFCTLRLCDQSLYPDI
ncbi:protein psiR-like isoform X2 [Galleria mellonella]|uniref:Protein psiR-like isoform X2 n=1 Tax=Galleria mellonella TaxID=7137 RepID=A0ABM3MY65_GALME|nr:protein psiR-like isoform X2 [Galleria mellonella]